MERSRRAADRRGNPFGAFGNVLVHIAWAAYFDDPRPTSFGLEDFDHFPKGTGCFLAPRSCCSRRWTRSARVSDWSLVSDDTQLIRWIAARHRIHLSPEFGCDYQPRTSLRGVRRQRALSGLDVPRRPRRTRVPLLPLAVGFYPVSAALALLVLTPAGRRARAVAVSVGGGAAVAARARRPVFETLSFAALAPVYAAAHGAGMWRALAARPLTARERHRT